MLKTNVSLGPVSSGTLRPEDLIPAFINELDYIRDQLAAPGPMTEPYDELAERRAEAARIDDFLGDIENRMAFVNSGHPEGDWHEGGGADYFDSEVAVCDLEELIEKINQYAPPYCYFSASEGDGACFGFWVNMDGIEEDISNGNVVKINAGDEWPEDEIRERLEAGCLDYVVEVSDNGNVALYTLDRREVWSVC